MIYYGTTRIGSVGNAMPQPVEKDVNFYDYDGTLLYSYTHDEAYALTALPPLPNRTSENLTNEGWNYTLQALKDQIDYNRSIINIGCTYHTTDGNSYFYFTLTKLEPIVRFYVRASTANVAHIDWGDGSNVSPIYTTNSLRLTHDYSNILNEDGKAEVVVKIVMNGLTQLSLRERCFNDPSISISCCSTLRSAKLSENIDLYSTTFIGNSIETISVPNATWVRSYSTSAFYNCYRLKCIVVGINATSITGSLHACDLLSNKIINILGCNCHTIASGAFSNNNSCPITIPMNSTITGNYAYMNYTKGFAIPKVSGTTLFRFGNSNQYYMTYFKINEGITTIGQTAFYWDMNLRELDLPSTLTTINGTDTLTRLYSLEKMYVRATTPPTLQATFGSYFPSNAVIYVPSASLATYQSAPNWSNYASQMVGM